DGDRGRLPRRAALRDPGAAGGNPSHHDGSRRLHEDTRLQARTAPSAERDPPLGALGKRRRVSKPRAVEAGIAFVRTLHDAGFDDRAARLRALVTDDATWWGDTGRARAARVRGH